MFSLFMGLWQFLFSKAELHLLIVGLDDAGKTTLLEQLKGMFGKKPGIPLDKIPPTVGLNIARVDLKRSRVIFWDLGGQERLRVIWNKYYSESHGVVFVIDSANEARFQEAKATLRAVNAIAQVLDVEAIRGAVAAHPVCALTTEGIEDAVNWLIDAVKASDRYYAKASGGGGS
ncbi:hypothetical protein PybrP1_000205 [[Pythium] brassicae (nom. inval.)]|nr:hypothetical protein PybrP1_000205 [[Pythium] brassicae (nom. inval.)]